MNWNQHTPCTNVQTKSNEQFVFNNAQIKYLPEYSFVECGQYLEEEDIFYQYLVMLVSIY